MRRHAVATLLTLLLLVPAGWAAVCPEACAPQAHHSSSEMTMPVAHHHGLQSQDVLS